MIEFCLVGGGLHRTRCMRRTSPRIPARGCAWVVDLDLAAAEALAAKHGGRASADLDEALADPDVGAVDDLHAAAHARGDHRARRARRKGGVLREADRPRHATRRRVRRGAGATPARRSSWPSTGASIRRIARCTTRFARGEIGTPGDARAVQPRPGDLAARLRRRDAVRHLLRHDDPRLRHGPLADGRRAGRDRRAHRVHARRRRRIRIAIPTRRW